MCDGGCFLDDQPAAAYIPRDPHNGRTLPRLGEENTTSLGVVGKKTRWRADVYTGSFLDPKNFSSLPFFRTI